jgi:hypothetical protein
LPGPSSIKVRALRLVDVLAEYSAHP